MQTDDDAVLDTLRRSYAPYVVDDPRAVDDFRLVFDGPSDVGRRIPVLDQGNCTLVRSRSTTRLLRALDAVLDRLASGGEPSVRLRDVGAIALGGAAVLVPQELLNRSSSVEGRILEFGATLADSPAVGLDILSGEVVVRSGLTGAAVAGDGREALLSRPGRYRLLRIYWLEQELADLERPSVAVARLLNHVETGCTLAPARLLDAAVDLRALSLPSLAIGASGTGELEGVLNDLANA